jgi:hypothetical protein
MEHNKTPGPVGFRAEFYLNLWEFIKLELLELFSILHARPTRIILHMNFFF